MSPAVPLDDGLSCIDLQFQGQPGVIASYLLEDGNERALIEVGPTSCLDALLQGLDELGVAPETIGHLLVTHIHLDHAGAAGSFMRRFPQARLYVHEIGAPHMIDPSRLIASAQRIYGEMMGPLWGDFEPVPRDRITVLTDGDSITIGRRKLTAVYTPGHASHHVVYHDPEPDGVFAGDVAAVRLQGHDYVRPPTPPPDLDLAAWSASIERVRDLQPRTLYLTHFGPFSDVESHLAQTDQRLHAWAGVIREALSAGKDRDGVIDKLRRYGDAEIARDSHDADGAIQRYELATPYFMSVDGYLRYFRRNQR